MTVDDGGVDVGGGAEVYGGGASPMSLKGLFMLGGFAGRRVDGVLFL